ncbi:hypothetical protein ACH5RR_041091 [Cinchona calisaya]|uniref:Uncharacterized protein n=1 Tax=Cinchona calisaya TaxID=153742 RepID=A0ABD2XSY4_9GENT
MLEGTELIKEEAGEKIGVWMKVHIGKKNLIKNSNWKGSAATKVAALVEIKHSKRSVQKNHRKDLEIEPFSEVNRGNFNLFPQHDNRLLELTPISRMPPTHPSTLTGKNTSRRESSLARNPQLLFLLEQGFPLESSLHNGDGSFLGSSISEEDELHEERQRKELKIICRFFHSLERDGDDQQEVRGHRRNECGYRYNSRIQRGFNPYYSLKSVRARSQGLPCGVFAKTLRILKNYSSLKERIIIVVETRISGGAAANMCAILPFNKSIIIDPNGFKGGLWILWNSQEVQIDLINKTSQSIHALIKVTSNSQPWLISAIYASSNLELRKSLWEDLALLQILIALVFCGRLY